MLLPVAVSAFLLDACNFKDLSPFEVREKIFIPFQKVLKSGLPEAKPFLLNCKQPQFTCIVDENRGFESQPNYEACNDLLKTVSRNVLSVPVLVESISIYKKLHPQQEHPVVTDYMLFQISVSYIFNQAILNQLLAILPVHSLPKLATEAYKSELNVGGIDFLTVKQIFKHERYVSGFEEPFELDGVSLYLRTRLTYFVSSIVFLQPADYWFVNAGAPVKTSVLAQMFSCMTRENGKIPDGRNAFRIWLYGKGDSNYELTTYLISTTSRRSLTVLKENSNKFANRAKNIGFYFNKIKHMIAIIDEVAVSTKDNSMVFESSLSPVLSAKGTEVAGVTRKSVYQSLDDLVGANYWGKRWADQLIDTAIANKDSRRIYEVISLCAIAHRNQWHDGSTNIPISIPGTALEAVYALKSRLIGFIELPMEVLVVSLVKIMKSNSLKKKDLIHEQITAKLEDFGQSPVIAEVKALLQRIYE